MDKKLKDRLAKANKNWTKAKTKAASDKGGEFDEIEDGRYIARLVDAEIGESKTSGRVQIIWKYRIVEGDYKGQQKFSFDGLETEDNLVYVARTLRRYGYEVPDDLADIERILKALSKDQPLVRIRLKTRGEFQNVYIDNVFDKEDEDEVLADARADAEESEDEEDGEDESTDETEEESDEEESGEDEEESGDEEEADEEESGDEDEEEASEDEEESEEESEDEEESDEVELAPGLKVIVPNAGKKVPGTVVEVLDKEDKVRVKLDSGKVVRVMINELEAAEDEAEDEDSDIPAKPSKKPEPTKKAAPAKKTAPVKGKKK